MTEVKVEIQRLLGMPPVATSVEFLQWAEKDLGTPAVLRKLPTTKSELSSYVAKFKTQKTNLKACSSTSKPLPGPTKPGCKEQPSARPAQGLALEIATGQPEATPQQSPQKAAPPACKLALAQGPTKDSAEAGKPTLQAAPPLAPSKAAPSVPAPPELKKNPLISQPEQEILNSMLPKSWEPADDWKNFMNQFFNGKKLDSATVAKLKNDIIEDDIKQLGKSYVDGGLEHWFQYHYTRLDEYAVDKKVSFCSHKNMLGAYFILTMYLYTGV